MKFQSSITSTVELILNGWGLSSIIGCRVNLVNVFTGNYVIIEIGAVFDKPRDGFAVSFALFFHFYCVVRDNFTV